MKRAIRYREGFTLIELMIVIAIIAVLVGLSVPITRSMVAKSRESSCLGNLRQIGMATQLYMDDNSGVLPNLEIGRADKSSDVPVMETVLNQYIESEEMFHCPADFEEFGKSGCSYNWNHTQSGRLLSQMSFFGEDKPERIPLVSDKEAWHPKGTNFLYADYSSSNKVRFVTGEE
ncbi:MAG: type II secretion system protein [Luteolibacter sp.]